MTTIRRKVQELRERTDRFLNREAKVRDLLKATIPLWLCLAVGTVVAVLVLIIQADDREASRLAQRTDSCQTRNSAQQAGRSDNVAAILGLGVQFGADTSDPRVVAVLATQSTPAVVDTDCDADGWLTTNDYVPCTVPDCNVPIDLPIKKEPPS